MLFRCRGRGVLGSEFFDKVSIIFSRYASTQGDIRVDAENMYVGVLDDCRLGELADTEMSALLSAATGYAQ